MRLFRFLLVGLILTSIGCTGSTNETKQEIDDSVAEDTVDDDADTTVEVVDPVVDDDDSDPEDSAEDEDTAPEEEPSPITWTDCSGMPGDKACDFTFQDQNGDDWSLYDHYGTVMVIDFSTMWCGVCKSIAGDAQLHQDAYTNRGYDFLWVTVLVDNVSWGVPPEPDDIQDWVSAYGMTTSPVLAGDRTVIDLTAADGYPISAWPTLVVVDETLTVHNGLLGWNEETVFGWVDEVFGIVH